MPKRELICGYGEDFKARNNLLIKNFFLFLKKNGSKILNLRKSFNRKSNFQKLQYKKENC